MTARSGGCCSAISRSTTKGALMKPMPTLAVALKWVASATSIDSTPGPHWPTWFGSMTNAQTLARGAAISTVPSKCMRPFRSLLRRANAHHVVAVHLDHFDLVSPQPHAQSHRVEEALVMAECREVQLPEARQE